MRVKEKEGPRVGNIRQILKGRNKVQTLTQKIFIFDLWSMKLLPTHLLHFSD